MKPARFEYFAPTTVEEAVSLMKEHGDSARVLAGGQSLVPLMNLRLARPRVLVDVNRVEGLSVCNGHDAQVSLGATVRQAYALADPELARLTPLVAAGLRHVGHPQNRTRGTVVGSLTHHDPAAEMPAVAVALDAEVMAVSSRGTRSIAAKEFFVSHYTTSLEPDEVATHVRFPSARPNTGAAFEELCRRTGDFALVGVAANLTVEDGRVVEARIALSAVAGRPVRARKTEGGLTGQSFTAETIADVARLTTEEDGLEPGDDIHATSLFRLSVLPIVAERAISNAWARAVEASKS